jgi:hypothetical protein
MVGRPCGADYQDGQGDRAVPPLTGIRWSREERSIARVLPTSRLAGPVPRSVQATMRCPIRRGEPVGQVEATLLPSSRRCATAWAPAAGHRRRRRHRHRLLRRKSAEQSGPPCTWATTAAAGRTCSRQACRRSRTRLVSGSSRRTPSTWQPLRSPEPCRSTAATSDVAGTYSRAQDAKVLRERSTKERWLHRIRTAARHPPAPQAVQTGRSRPLLHHQPSQAGPGGAARVGLDPGSWTRGWITRLTGA